MQEGYQVLDNTGKAVAANPALSKMTGFSPRDLINVKPPFPYWPPEECANIQKAFAKVLKGKKRTYNFELTFMRKNGQRFPVIVSPAALRNRAGKVIGFAATVKDVTEINQKLDSIRKREQFLEEVLQTLPQAVFGKDIKNNFQWNIWNHGAEELFGIKAEDSIGKCDRDFFPKEQADFFRLKDIEATQNAGVIDIPQEPANTANGRVVLHTRKTVLHDSNGNPSVLLAVAEDITERTKTETENATALNLLRQIASRIPGVIYQFLQRADGSSCFPYSSEAMVQIYRLTPEDVKEDASKVFKIIHPDDFNEVVASIQKSAENLTLWVHEYRVRFEDGTVNWLLGNASPMRNPDGSTLWHGFISDISERKKVENALKESEDKLKKLFSILPVGAAIFDRQGRIREANVAMQSMLEVSVEELKSSSCRDLNFLRPDGKPIEDDELPSARALREQVLIAGVEFGLRTENDKMKWIEACAAPLPWDDSACVVIIQNITERKEIEKERLRLTFAETKAREQAESANRIKDEFLATLSHELRTPLTTIMSWTQLLRGGKLGPEQINHGLKTLEQSALAQGRLIDDLLDISRIQSDKLNLSIQKVDSAQVVGAAIESTRSLAASKSIPIEVRIDPAAKYIFADPIRLQQIFWNLITNALKFSPENAPIQISMDSVVAAKGECVRIQVSDNGKGISPDFLPVIFERFSQVDSTSTRAHGGLGLGLSIVKKLVEMHEGTIEVQSPGEGKGSTFTVLLPILKANTKISIAETEAAFEKEVSLSGLRILLVDDDESAREVFAIMLKHFGAEMVKTAGSAAEALKLFNEFKPDILVSDISMPIEDGYSLIKKVRAQESKLAGTPAVALTAFAGKSDIEKTLSAGFQTHLAKPVNAKKLALAIFRLAGPRA